MFFLTLTALVAAHLASAAPFAGPVDKPLAPRQVEITDDVILNYALTLEMIEDNFYQRGLFNFSESDFAAAGFDSDFYGNLTQVSYDEVAHINFLTAALDAGGFQAVERCEYTFPVTDVPSFIQVASILEGVGVSAFLGAAAEIAEAMTLTAAGSILTSEARHSSFVRSGLGLEPFAQPFDIPLNYNQVFTLASPFIVSCPESNPALPVMAYPPVMLDPATEMPVVAGDTITLLTPEDTLISAEDSPIWAAFMAVTGPTFVPAEPVEGGFTIEIPEGFAGQSYVILTGSDEVVADDTVAAGPAVFEISGDV